MHCRALATHPSWFGPPFSQAAEQRLGRLKVRVAASQAAQSGDGDVVAATEKAVEDLKYLVMERLPKELEKRQTRLALVDQAAALGDLDLARLEEERRRLELEASEAQARKQAVQQELAQSKEYLALRQQQQMAGLVEKKKDEVAAKLRRLEDKRAGLMRQYERLVEELGLGQAEVAPGAGVSPEELAARQAEVRAQLDAFKQRKRELDEARSELLVLERTERLLVQAGEEVRVRVRQLEAQFGIEGASEVQSGLEKLSEQKAGVDEAKGAVLSSISNTVGEIQARIKQRQDDLVPKIKGLKDLRARVQEVESAREKVDEETTASIGKLQTDVEKLYTVGPSGWPSPRPRHACLNAVPVPSTPQEYAELESRYHQLSAQSLVVDSHIRRATNPSETQGLQERLKARIKRSEEESASLQDRAREAQSLEDVIPQQKEILETLKNALQAKLQWHQVRRGRLLLYSSDGRRRVQQSGATWLQAGGGYTQPASANNRETGGFMMADYGANVFTL